MAAETTTTGVATAIPSKTLARAIRLYPRLTPAALSVAWIDGPEVGVKPTIAHHFNRLATATVVTTKAEGSSFTRYARTTLSTTATPAFVGSELAITDEVSMQSEGPMLTDAFLLDVGRALAVRWSTDLMATILGSTNTVGSDTTTLTRDLLMSYIGTYWALNLGDAGMHAMLLSNAASAHLGRDTVSTTATTAEMQNQFGMGILLGEFQGFAVVRAAEAPVEGAGFSSCITPVGNGQSGLLVALAEAPNLRPAQRGAEGERDAETYHVARACYGVADDDGFYLELQTAA